MGKMKEHPRYNIVSARVSDEMQKKMDAAVKKSKLTRSEWLMKVLEEVLG